MVLNLWEAGFPACFHKIGLLFEPNGLFEHATCDDFHKCIFFILFKIARPAQILIGHSDRWLSSLHYLFARSIVSLLPYKIIVIRISFRVLTTSIPIPIHIHIHIHPP